MNFLDAFYQFFISNYERKDFQIVKQNLTSKDKQNVIVLNINKTIQLPLSLLYQADITIVVLSRADQLSYEVSNEIRDKFDRSFMKIIEYGNKKYRILSLLSSNITQIGYNGYSYQYNIDGTIIYAEI